MLLLKAKVVRNNNVSTPAHINKITGFFLITVSVISKMKDEKI